MKNIFFKLFLTRQVSDRAHVTFSRIVIIILGLFAFTLAMISEISGKTVFGVVSYAWSGVGASFGPALILTLWWKRTTKTGIISGLVTGALITIIWANIDSLRIMVTERLVSFVFAFVIIIIVSMIDSSKGNEKVT